MFCFNNVQFSILKKKVWLAVVQPAIYKPIQDTNFTDEPVCNSVEMF
ncbi:hypothetical protein LX99_01297 [Mucilaginibacter oryzae]|uniref:Uncharacterized protein n=1 Tax=Mucilaginibacter oryzae TaxID=468058 RepID=A0A316HCI6_9SPHI|nr:hypothetical protein LX99_01297 [Mucilaginibacter oryzae]